VSGLGHYARNVGMLVGQSFVQRVAGMIVTIILARVLGAANLGAYGVVMSTSNSAYGLVRLGVDGAIHVSTAEGHANAETRQRMQEVLAAGCLLLVLAGTVGGLACGLFGQLLAQTIYGEPGLAVWIRIAGFAVFAQAVSQFFYTTLAGLHRFAAYARVMIASALLNLVTIVPAVLVADLPGAVAALVGVQVVTTVMLGAAMRSALRQNGLRLVFRNTVLQSRRLLAFGMPFYLAGLVAIPVVYVLQGLVVRHAGIEEFGYLRVILSLVAIVAFAPTSAAGAMISLFASTRAAGDGQLAVRVVQNLRVILVLALALAAFVTIASPWLIPALFGEAYLPAIAPTSIALITAVLTAANGVVSNALLSARRVTALFMLTALQAAVFFALGLILIPALGLTGYLLAELAAHAAALSVALLFTTSWLTQNGVGLAWLPGALGPILVMAAYAVRHTYWEAMPGPGEGVLGLVALVFLSIWIYWRLLSGGERKALWSLILRLGRGRVWPDAD